MDDYFLNKLFSDIFMYKRNITDTSHSFTNDDGDNSHFHNNIIIIEYFINYYYNSSYMSELKRYSLNANGNYEDVNIYVNLMSFSDKSVYKDLFKIFNVFYDNYQKFKSFTMDYKEFINILHDLSLIQYWSSDFICNKEILSSSPLGKKLKLIDTKQDLSNNESSCGSYLLNLFSKYKSNSDKENLLSLPSKEDSLKITMCTQCNFYYVVNISDIIGRTIKTTNNFKISISFYLSYPYKNF